MTPEERARKIVRDLFYDTEWDNLVSYGAEAIATAIREAVAEKAAENKRLREALDHLITDAEMFSDLAPSVNAARIIAGGEA